MKLARFFTTLCQRKDNGLTLVELLVALAISSTIMGAAFATFNQLILFGPRTDSRMLAMRQVQQVGIWISRDGIMAQKVMTDDPGTSETEFITLIWTDWDTNTKYRIAYILDEENQLTRNSQVASDPVQTSLVATHIEPSGTSATWQNGVLTVVVAAQVALESETRTYQVKPRSVGAT